LGYLTIFFNWLVQNKMRLSQISIKYGMERDGFSLFQVMNEVFAKIFFNPVDLQNHYFLNWSTVP
jgi:hypothetical protein